MEHLIASTLRALRSLFTPGMLGVFVVCVLTTIGALIGFVACAGFFFSWLAEQLQGHAIAGVLPWLGTFGSGLIAWFLFPGIMPIIASFFDERIARLIEAKEYPGMLPARQLPFWPELLHDLRFAAVAIALNILVLPLYLLPLINIFLFYVLNGYLLGREFFVVVAKRHRSREEAEALRKRYGRSIMTAGITLAVMATIPILNLFAPFWGIAVMVHLYHGLAATPRIEILPLG